MIELSSRNSRDGAAAVDDRRIAAAVL